MGTLFDRWSQALRFFRTLSWSEQTLLSIAILTYASSGLYLALFSQGFDFPCFYQAAHRIVIGQGATVYTEFFTLDPTLHPVMFGYAAPVALLYSPLGFFSQSVAWGLFQSVCHLCLWMSCWLAILEVRDRGTQASTLRVTISLALFFPLYYSLWMGQCEPVILMLILATMRFYRRKHWLLAGLALAVVMWLKIFLMFTLLYFLIVRRWRLLARILLSLVVLESLSLLVIPIDVQRHFWQFAPQWTAHMRPFFDNQAIGGVVSRLLTTNAYTRGLVDQPVLSTTVQWMAMGALVLVFVRRVKAMSTTLFGDGFSYALVTAMLISPLTDTHHFTLLLIPFLLLGTSARPGSGWRWFYAFFAVFVPVAVFKYPDYNRCAYFESGLGTLVYSIPFMMLLALWFYLPRSFRAVSKTPSLVGSIQNE